ncbi:bifunctional UDP-N-acetylglucosamine diphosphorylase/glucosamine-1-phosphate N-acetyltransferase GlmU [Aliikangiella coralliicola]|uniref:Bifunctional protein GlmU n=1 Tax=Aliikangiella coralliicola TaxID=2592383 RepID=A0A545UGL8_9GAMM|nr:bifunctional UDP-N-acetylglucosamine diphosphorylase/glucosamine-1-phosphate N-acetyltransferase GlmU [Aliikangiella coralliicola]TQV88619.1 UDP-N-acetylglucosamine diphosphorylase/glucosamine-1-phosphate N-acetyltransferase [Aliikangiella coralliicola]
MDIQVIILAAGKGSRMKSRLPKVLHQIAGKSLVQHVIDSCRSMGANHCHLVVGHGAEAVKQAVDGGRVELSFVEQKQQLGTGHAVKVALDGLKPDTPTLILYGDVPLIHHDTLSELVAIHESDKSGIALMTCFLDDPTGYGRITRDADDRVTGIVEHKDASDEQKKINEINTGILCCNSNQLTTWINQLNNDNAQGEYYLTDIIAMAVAEGNQVTAMQPKQLFEVEGINTLRQLAELERVWQLEMAKQLMGGGVTFLDPTRFDLRGTLTCESDVVIDINCIIEGRVCLHEGARIGPNVVLKDCVIGAGSVIKANSVIEDSTVDQGCSVGPFARLRPGTHLRDDSHVGNFVEIKKSTIGEGSKAGHLAYIGDSEVGRQVNIGAGTITCNYDGANKHKTIIEDGAFIGSDTQLVAPVRIGKNVTVGAGTTVTSDVEDNALCTRRVKQKNITGWKRPTKQK